MPQGLQVFRKREVVSAADEINTPAKAARVNRNRTWRKRAHPKSIAHVVFQVANPQASYTFFKDRLGFRLSDTQRKLGCYARADGSHEHHNIFFFNADFLPPPVRKLGFNHTAFACDDIDEMMVGANYLERKGWATKRPGGFVGLGRHRISSALFYYIPCPAGGHAEYLADQDYLDDSWMPRDWEENFGGSVWIHDMPEHLKKPYSWDVKLLRRGRGEVSRRIPGLGESKKPALLRERVFLNPRLQLGSGLGAAAPRPAAGAARWRSRHRPADRAAHSRGPTPSRCNSRRRSRCDSFLRSLQTNTSMILSSGSSMPP